MTITSAPCDREEIADQEIVPAFFDAEAWAWETATEEHYFDEKAAEHACQFFPRYLCFIKGEVAGRPFELEPWLKSITRAAFGFKRKSDGLRRFRFLYIELPRKNVKTTYAAGLACYMTFCDGEPGAEGYSVANDKDQARICFKIASEMRKRSEPFQSRTLASKNSIFSIKDGQSYQPLSSDYGNKDGLDSHVIIYDEFHKFRNRELFDVMHTSTVSRRQPMEIIITVAGTDRHSICYEQHVHAEQVRDKIIVDEEFLPVIYAADPDDDFEDPQTWAKANPNLGKSVRFDYMKKEAAKARVQPSYENTFKRQHLNIWTEQVKRWLSVETWNHGGPHRDTPLEQVAAIIAAEEKKLLGRRCLGGLDLARVSDLTALALLFPPVEEDELWKVIFRFWCPEENIRTRSKRDRVPYELWRKYGFITPTPGNTTDFKFVEKEILDLSGIYDLAEVAYDRTFAGEIVNNLTEEGLTMVPFGQGFLSMASPTAELERKVVGQQLWHGGHPIARWNAANVTVKKDPAGNIKPDKEKSVERIDGIVALIEALGRASVVQEQKPPTPGIVIL